MAARMENMVDVLCETMGDLKVDLNKKADVVAVVEIDKVTSDLSELALCVCELDTCLPCTLIGLGKLVNLAEHDTPAPATATTLDSGEQAASVNVSGPAAVITLPDASEPNAVASSQEPPTLELAGECHESCRMLSYGTMLALGSKWKIGRFTVQALFELGNSRQGDSLPVALTVSTPLSVSNASFKGLSTLVLKPPKLSQCLKPKKRAPKGKNAKTSGTQPLTPANQKAISDYYQRSLNEPMGDGVMNQPAV